MSKDNVKVSICIAKMISHIPSLIIGLVLLIAGLTNNSMIWFARLFAVVCGLMMLVLVQRDNEDDLKESGVK